MIIGGQASAVSTSIEFFNTSDGTTWEGNFLSASDYYVQPFTHGSRVFIPPGANTVHSNVTVYESANNTVSTFQLRDPRSHTCSVYINNLYIFASKGTASIWNVTSQSWLPNVNLVDIEHGNACAATSFRAMWCGSGLDGSTLESRCTIYTASTNLWASIPALVWRFHNEMTVFESKILLVGGWSVLFLSFSCCCCCCLYSRPLETTPFLSFSIHSFSSFSSISTLLLLCFLFFLLSSCQDFLCPVPSR
jgi:hypothetical protein